jgi:hypothetical protein
VVDEYSLLNQSSAGVQGDSSWHQVDSEVTVHLALPQAMAHLADFEVEVRGFSKHAEYRVSMTVLTLQYNKIMQEDECVLLSAFGVESAEWECTILPLLLDFYEVRLSVFEKGPTETFVVKKVAPLSMIDVGAGVGHYEVGNTLRNLSIAPPRDLWIAFIGDSVTRYQYLSFVYFLRWGRWFDPEETPNLVRLMRDTSDESKSETSYDYFNRTRDQH